MSSIYYGRITPCLGGIRLSNLHQRKNCPFLNRCDSRGTLFELDLENIRLPAALLESLTGSQAFVG